MMRMEELETLIESTIMPLSACSVPLDETRGLQMATDLFADHDEPPFDRSAMDGFAIAEAALPGWFSIIGETLPGAVAAETPQEHQALRIFTGSALPPKVQVVMQEHVLEKEGQILITALTHAGHVRRRGSAKKKGGLLIPSGTIVSPAVISILALAGVVAPLVIPRPRIAHLTTGSEIIPVHALLSPGKIRNTNAPLMRALVEESGASYTTHHHVDESLSYALLACKDRAIQEADLLFISGGASHGKHDHTAELLERLGFALICRKVNCRPGKPFLLGIRGSQVAIGLPGNPVSHFVTFHLFVRRVIHRLAGWSLPLREEAILTEGTPLQSHERETFWPALLNNCGVTPLPWLDSGDLTALLKVNALIRIPSSTIPSIGSSVEIIRCGTNRLQPTLHP
jgi:molybdopterin molybdotransferase